MKGHYIRRLDRAIKISCRDEDLVPRSLKVRPPVRTKEVFKIAERASTELSSQLELGNHIGRRSGFSKVLTPAEEEFLKLGLNFVPAPKKLPLLIQWQHAVWG